jgi:hypothetical protein
MRGGREMTHYPLRSKRRWKWLMKRLVAINATPYSRLTATPARRSEVSGDILAHAVNIKTDILKLPFLK